MVVGPIIKIKRVSKILLTTLVYRIHQSTIFLPESEYAISWVCSHQYALGQHSGHYSVTHTFTWALQKVGSYVPTGIHLSLRFHNRYVHCSNMTAAS